LALLSFEFYGFQPLDFIDARSNHYRSSSTI